MDPVPPLRRRPDGPTAAMRSVLLRRTALMSLGDALAALGSDGVMDSRRVEVPVSAIVGSAARASDFDAAFRPRHRNVRPMHPAIGSAGMPPVRLVQLGELYFVVDGHHRISAAHRAGVLSVDADVSRICTIAFASACIRQHHLVAKAAERRFLERVPLADDIRRGLWLDEPHQWARLSDAFEAWGFRAMLAQRCVAVRREELAARWWSDEVLPTVAQLWARDGDSGDRYATETYWRALMCRDKGLSI